MIREAPEVPKTILTIIIFLGCPPYIDDMTLLLKVSYNLATKYEEINLEMVWKLPAG